MINQSATLAAGASADHAHVTIEPGHWNGVHEPAAGVKASVTLAALPTKGRHVCRNISISLALASGSVANAIVHVRLLDGPSGSGNILRSWVFAEGPSGVHESGLSIVGSPNTAMTLEFSAAPSVNTDFQTVGFGGYNVTDGV